MPASESYQSQMLTIPAGEPNLSVAILAASRSKAASYVYALEDVPGWHVRDSRPATKAYFRVSCKRVYVRSDDGQEVFFGRVAQGTIVQEGTGIVNATPQRRRR